MLKTGEQWQKLCKIKISDPLGWNPRYKFKTDGITRDEFEINLINSVVMHNSDINVMIDGKVNKQIWKDV